MVTCECVSQPLCWGPCTATWTSPSLTSAPRSECGSHKPTAVQCVDYCIRALSSGTGGSHGLRLKAEQSWGIRQPTFPYYNRRLDPSTYTEKSSVRYGYSHSPLLVGTMVRGQPVVSEGSLHRSKESHVRGHMTWKSTGRAMFTPFVTDFS